jgi:lipopolysaccharide biosynthesis glycosyltransferase
VPNGRLAAVEDISFFCRHDVTAHGRSVRKYFRGLGINPENGYFNAGVFSVTRNTWRALANEALEFFVSNTETCRYHDQSALNAVIGDRRLRLSPAWNFQTPYRYWNIEKEIGPVVYHFTQGPKPWNGPVEPWIEVSNLYESQIPAFARLGLPLERLPEARIAALNAHSRMYKRKLRCLFPLRLHARREMLRKLVSASVPRTVAA